MLVLAIGLPVTAFGSLVGILPASAFVVSGAVWFLFSTASLMLIGLNGPSRRPFVVRRTPATVRTVAAVGPMQSRNSCGIRCRQYSAA